MSISHKTNLWNSPIRNVKNRDQKPAIPYGRFWGTRIGEYENSERIRERKHTRILVLNST